MPEPTPMLHPVGEPVLGTAGGAATRAGFRQLTLLEQTAVVDCLRLHCRRDAKGFAVYEAEWNDDRVKTEAAPTYPGGISAVSRIRKELFGLFDPTPADPQADRLAALEARVTSPCRPWWAPPARTPEERA